MSLVQPHLIPTEGLLKFRHYYFVREWGKQVMLAIFKYNFLHGTTKTIYEIMVDSGINFGKKSRFNDGEKIKLSRNIPLESLDITLMYKICQVLWEKGVNDPSDALKALMKKIKDERNNVSHEEGNISEGELLINLNDFGKTLDTALDEANALYSSLGADFNKLKADIMGAIPKIQEKIREMYDPSNPLDGRKLLSELENYKDLLYECVQEKSMAEFRDLYGDLCKIFPFDWLCQYDAIDPSGFMVPLKIETDVEFHPKNANKVPITLDEKDILDIKCLPNTDPKVVVLSGNAGSGKTTMLSSIVEKWYKEVNDITNLSSFQTLLYMQFRSDDHDNFEDFIGDILPRTISYFGLNHVKESILNSKCLVLCDGYDEINAKSKKLFQSLLRLKCKEMKIIITTRPVSTKELTETINKEKLSRINLKLLGVTKQNMESHIKNVTSYLVSDRSDRDKMEKEIIEVFRKMHYKMLIVLKNPLWLNLYILLYNECPEKRQEIFSVTTLYINLEEHNKQRISKNLEIEEESVEEFDKFYQDQSLEYHYHKKYELSQEDNKVFREKCKKLNIDFESIMSSYFNIKHTKKGLNIVKVYCYKHRSQQEYAAAVAVANTIIKYCTDSKNIIEELKKEGKNRIRHILVTQGFMKCKQEPKDRTNSGGENKDLSQTEYLAGLMAFITGILYSSDNKDILFEFINDILDIHWELEQMHHGSDNYVDSMIEHCFEVGNDAKCLKAVIKKITKIINAAEGKMMCRELESLPSLPLIIPELKPESLLLDYFHCSEREELVEALRAISQSGVNLKLILGRISKLNDEWIKKAKTCNRFEGELGEEGVSAIPICMEHMELRVRISAMKAVSARLRELKNLQTLTLFLHIDDTDDLSGLQLLHFPPSLRNVILRVIPQFDVWDDSKVALIAQVLNSIWPKERSKSLPGSFNIFPEPSQPPITGAAIKLLAELLTVRSLRLMTFWNVSIEAMEAKKELLALYKEKGIGTLDLMCFEQFKKKGNNASIWRNIFQK